MRMAAPGRAGRQRSDDHDGGRRMFPYYPHPGGPRYPWAQLMGPLPRAPPLPAITALPGTPRGWRWPAWAGSVTGTISMFLGALECTSCQVCQVGPACRMRCVPLAANEIRYGQGSSTDQFGTIISQRRFILKNR